MNKPNNSNSNNPCLFCGEISHMSSNCQQYNTWQGRVEKLESEGRCKKCASGTHVSSDDCGFIKCKICLRSGHIGPLCHKKILSLEINKGRERSEILPQ